MAADVPMALNRLKAAINAGNASPPVEKEDEVERLVSLGDTDLPLINLLTAAVEGECNVMWK